MKSLGRPLVGFVAATGMVMFATGCAHTYVDGEGGVHVVGFVWQTSLKQQSPTIAESLRTRSVGLSLTQSEAGLSMTAGYSDATMAFIRDNSVVDLQALLVEPAARQHAGMEAR